ncbi:MAG TPA: MFS transporter [Gemmatimonadales bacterium]|nr:MFS transporter [Gemmatimonadales bacterium]
MTSPARPPCDEAVIRSSARGGRGCPEDARRWVLAATILGSSMAFIDGSVVNVALPVIQSDLDMSVSGVQWVVNCYMLMLSALILVGGAAGDRFGRRRVFVIGIAVFTAASVACGLAPGAGMLIAARAVQGVGGALLVPSSLAIISAGFPEGERGRAIGTWAGFSALTTALGPVLGGWLVDVWSWRLIFLVNVPIAAAALLLARHVPESRNESDAPLDWRGALLAVAGLGAIVEGLTAASQLDWRQPAVFGSLLGGALLLGVFLRHEARTASPMVPLELFRSRAFAGANAMTFLLYFAVGGALFFLPFNLIRTQHYSAAQAGAAFLPFTLVMGVLSRWSGGLVDRYGARLPLTVGPLIAAAGLALLAVPGIGGSLWSTFFPPMLILGLGMSVSVAPLTTTVMGAVPENHAGTASGINNAIARLAGMLAVAVLGAVAVAVFGSALKERLEGVRVPASVRDAVLQEVPRLAEARVPAQAEGLRGPIEAALAQSFVASFRVVMLVAAGLAVLSSVCAWLSIAGKSRAAGGRRLSP